VEALKFNDVINVSFFLVVTFQYAAMTQTYEL
jgi:hypothetical protein